LWSRPWLLTAAIRPNSSSRRRWYPPAGLRLQVLDRAVGLHPAAISANPSPDFVAVPVAPRKSAVRAAPHLHEPDPAPARGRSGSSARNPRSPWYPTRTTSG
jgi:hypothetical protein